MIKDNQMIYIDAGSSTFEMLNYVRAKNITVVTIGLPHIARLKRSSTHTILLGRNDPLDDGSGHWQPDLETTGRFVFRRRVYRR